MRTENAKGKFLAACFVLAIVYIGFSFAMHAYADPPSSPYTPGETLNPNCSPTSTDCTVLPPLFSTSTLPQGGILFMNDTSGTVTANTSSLYWNASATMLEVGPSPEQASTGTLLLLGSNLISGGNVSGTWFGVNAATSTGADFLNFQVNSSSLFQVASSGAVTINENAGTQLQVLANAVPTLDLVHIANSATTTATIAGLNNLQSDYFGGAGAIEAANIKLTITDGPTSGSVWDGLRVVENTTTQTGVTENAIKIDPITNGPGIENAIFVGNGWQTGILVAGNPAAVASSSLLQLASTSIETGNTQGTFIGINPLTFTGDFVNFQVNSTTKFEIGSNGNVTTTNLSVTGVTNALDLLTVNGTVSAYPGSACAGGAAAISISATGTVTCATYGTLTTSTAGLANFVPMWTSASALGNSWIQQGTNALIVASGTGKLPFNSTSTSILQLGSSSIQLGNASGTWFGINASSGFIGDFTNFQVNSTTEFDVSATGTLTLAGNLTVSGLASTSQAFIASSTITKLTFTNATGTGNLQVATLHTTGALTASTTLSVQATSSFVGRMFLGTSTLSNVTGTSTLVVCPIGTACTASSTASTTDTVVWVGSINNAATGNSIVAKGSIASGQSDVGEFIPIVGDDSDYSQGEVLSAVESSTGVLFGPSQTAYDPNLAGAVTITAGLIAGGGTDHGTTVIALAGRIPVNVTTENGSIYTGNYITSSNIPGVGMLATEPGRIIGMALADDVADPDNPDATSQVMMLVNPGWSLGDLTSTTEIASSSWALDGVDDTNGQVVLDQFTAYVQSALAKLGLALENGVATLQQVIADTITTNELCVQGTCINGSQLSNLLNNSSPPAPQASLPARAASPAPTSPSPSTAVTPTSTDLTSTSDSTSTPDDSGSSTDVSAPVNDTTTPIIASSTDDTSTDTSTDDASSMASSTSGQ